MHGHKSHNGKKPVTTDDGWGWKEVAQVAAVVFCLYVFCASTASIIIISRLQNEQPSVTGQLLTTASSYSQDMLTTDGWVKMAGLDTADTLEQVLFTPNGTLTYTGASPARLLIGLTVVFHTDPASTLFFAVAIKGAIDDGATPVVAYSQAFGGFGNTMSMQFLYTAEPGDVFEPFVKCQDANTTATFDQFGGSFFIGTA